MFKSLFSPGTSLNPLKSSLFLGQSWKYFSEGMAKQLTFAQINDRLKAKDTILIDVREKGELQTDGKIDGSKNVPVGEIGTAFKMNDGDFEDKYGFKKPKPSESVIIHCKAGIRAQNAAKLLTEAGYSNIQVYPGILDWEKNGGKLQK